MFACAHPALEVGIRAPLMLQAVLGLDAKMIASAFLTSPAAMGKRLVRAKNKIRQAGIPFGVPGREELPGRLDTVLDAIYAAFAEGWTDPGGTDVVRRNLTGEAIFLARLLAELLPEQPEALGLLALMLHAEARRRARRNRDGEYVPLAEQNTALWDWQMIDEAEALLRRASALSFMGDISLKAPCSRRTSIVAARVKPTGQKWCSFTTRCQRSPAPRGRHQSRPGHRGVAGRQHRSRGDAGSSRRRAPRRLPTVLGCARGAAGQDRRAR
jgi:predicted RNA polymerase sigma factor